MHLTPTTEEGAGWATHVRQLARYGAHRDRALGLADYLCDNADRVGWFGPEECRHRAAKLRACGELLEFTEYPAAGEVRLTAAHFCQQDRLCGLCACRRGGRYLGAYLERVEALRASRPNLEAFLTTVTVRDGPDLAERFEHLHAGLSGLMQRRLNARKGLTACSLEGTEGGVWSIEVKRGSGSGEWHPHAHAVVLAEPDRAPNPRELMAEWKALTGDSFVVDVRPIGHGPADLAEVFKYAVKFGDLSFDDNLEAASVLKGRRLVRSFGCLRGLDPPDQLVDDPLEGLEWVAYLYRHHFGRGYGLVRTRYSAVVPVDTPAPTG